MDKHASCSFFGAENQSPEGESKESFTKRSLAGFERALLMCGCDKQMLEGRYKPVGGKAASGFSMAVFVVHGGTIMSIMERYAVPKGTYYDFQIGMEKVMNLFWQMILPLLAGFILDLILGDPVWLYHPVRMIGF